MKIFTLPTELEELTALKNWVCYKLEPRPTKADPDHLGKVPYNPETGSPAKAHDPRTWTDYEIAQEAFQRGLYDGIGFELGNSGYCGIDIDDCVTDGIASAPAAAIVGQIDSYTEISISGTGLHIITKSAPLGRWGYDLKNRKEEDIQEGDVDDLEVYRPTEKQDGKFSGEIGGGRFLTISGNVYGDARPINERTAEVRALVNHYWPPKPEPATPAAPAVGSSVIQSADADRKMVQSALATIDPSGLDFDQWASVCSALKELGYSANDAEAWSAKNGNPKHVNGYIYRRWEKFHLQNRDSSNSAGVIINIAKGYGWTPADAFTEDERREYGRKLHEGAAKDTTAPAAVADHDQPQPQPEPEPLKGLLTLDSALQVFEDADDHFLELKYFPAFSKAAKIATHDSVILAADTGFGKSSLALNWLNDLNKEYPCIYFNLEMSPIIVLRRLVAIESGKPLNQVEGYKNDERTAAMVKAHLEAITARKPLQIVNDVYTLEAIEETIKTATAGRKEPTIVFIDHALLARTRKGRLEGYALYSHISGELRRMALKYNIVMFVLTQQNRSGKADENERPKNSSLKESGNFENDSTHTTFLWWNPSLNRRVIFMNKNRGGETGVDYVLNYWAETQRYTEAKDQPQQAAGTSKAAAAKKSRRQKARERLENAYELAFVRASLNGGGGVSLRDIAEAADVTTGTVKNWIKEYGGCEMDGEQVSPAGVDTMVEWNGFITLKPCEQTPLDEDDNQQAGAIPRRGGGTVKRS